MTHGNVSRSDLHRLAQEIAVFGELAHRLKSKAQADNPVCGGHIDDIRSNAYAVPQLRVPCH